MLPGMAFHQADTHRATSEVAARKEPLKERCGLDSRIYGIILFVFTFMQGIDTHVLYLKQTVFVGFYVATVLYLQFVLHVMLFRT